MREQHRVVFPASCHCSQRTRSPTKLKLPLLLRTGTEGSRSLSQSVDWGSWAGSSCCPREQCPVAGLRDRHPRLHSAPLLCWCLSRPPGDLHPSSGARLASSLMGDACKIHSQVVSALFFKQGAAFSACYTAGEEPGGCSAATSPLSSRDTQGNGPPCACRNRKGKVAFPLVSFSFSSVNNTSRACFQHLGPV